MKHARKSKSRAALAVNSKADTAARADVLEAIRQGLDDVAHGRTRPAREVFNELRRKRHIPR